MNGPTLITLIIVLLIVGHAAYRVYKMVRNNDLCYACDHKGQCGCCGNPINCSIKKE